MSDDAQTLLVWAAILGFLFGPDDGIAGAAKVVVCGALIVILASGRFPW